MPMKKTPNERMRDIAREISGDVFVRISTTVSGNWLDVCLHYGTQTIHAHAVIDIDTALDVCLDEAEASLGMYIHETAEEVAAL
jgi:hypothetical protein